MSSTRVVHVLYKSSSCPLQEWSMFFESGPCLLWEWFMSSTREWTPILPFHFTFSHFASSHFAFSVYENGPCLLRVVNTLLWEWFMYESGPYIHDLYESGLCSSSMALSSTRVTQNPLRMIQILWEWSISFENDPCPFRMIHVLWEWSMSFENDHVLWEWSMSYGNRPYPLRMRLIHVLR